MVNHDEPTTDQGLERSEGGAHQLRSTMPYAEVLREVVKYLAVQPLLLFPLAAIMLLAAAATLAGADTVRALTTPVLALAVLGILAWLYNDVRSAKGRTVSYLSDDFGLEIRKPRDGFKSSTSEIEVEGQFRRQPPEGALRVFTTDGRRFWPQSIPRFHADRRWSVRVGIGDLPSNLTIVAAIVGPSTRVLLDYYRKVRDFQNSMPPEFRKSVPLDALPEDAVKRCSVNVTRL